MSNSTRNSKKRGKEGERARPPKSKQKKKIGRPRGTTKEVMALRKKDTTGSLDEVAQLTEQQIKVITRQRGDCRKLALSIKHVHNRCELTPRDVSALATSTRILHELERSAYDMDKQGAQVKAVIVIPAGPASMEAWNAAAKEAIGQATSLPEPSKARRIEADIVDEPEDDQEGAA